jgi:hypothetical protein
VKFHKLTACNEVEFAFVKFHKLTACNEVEFSHAKHGIAGVVVPVTAIILYFNVSTPSTCPAALEPPFLPTLHERKLRGAKSEDLGAVPDLRASYISYSLGPPNLNVPQTLRKSHLTNTTLIM